MILAYATYVFLYPFVVWPGFPYREFIVLSKHLFLGVFLLVNALFCWVRANPGLHLSNMPVLLKTMLGEPILRLLSAWGIVIFLATLLSPEPWVAWLGSLSDFTNGFVWNLFLLLLVGVLYGTAKRYPDLENHLARAVVFGGVLLVGLAVMEVALGKGFYYHYVAPSNLPMVTFPGKGHLAGYFVLVAGLGIGLRNPWAIFLSALGAGLVYNRASLVAFAVLTAIALLRAPRFGVRIAVLLGLGVLSGMGIARAFPWAEVREVTDARTLEQRFYMWKAAIRGIADRPFLGWGGGVFEVHWAKYLTEDELKEFVPEFGPPGSVLVEIGDVPGADPTFLLRKPDGGLAIVRVRGFSSHNQFLDVTLHWGLAGLVFYVFLLGLGLRGVRDLSPAAMALLGAHVFYLFWFSVPEQEGVLWALWGIALARVATTTGGSRP